MSDRLSGRVEPPGTSNLHRAANGDQIRDDYAPLIVAAHRRLTGARLLQIDANLTPVDRAVMEAMATVRMATGNQLNRLFWPTTPSGARSTRRHLKRLTDLRILTRLDRRIGGIKSGSAGYTYALDIAGQRLLQGHQLGAVRRPTPSDTFVDHTIAVTEIYIRLSELDRDGLIEQTYFRTEPDCWRHHAGRGGRTEILKPDAYAQWTVGEWELLAFFEADRATEHPGRIRRKVEHYVRYWRTGDEQREAGVFPSVVWLTPTDRRAALIRDVIASVEHAAQFSTAIQSEALTSFITNTREEVNP